MSCGRGSCGLHAVEQLRSVFPALHTVTLRTASRTTSSTAPLRTADGPLTGRNRPITVYSL
ncbi:hypothetical protein [Streptomyces tsukubensis]|uniref:hypothetical protein n=1 Tax=Streptomyces tsukubensis TaxID=83656 RepID=UPI003F4E7690